MKRVDRQIKVVRFLPSLIALIATLSPSFAENASSPGYYYYCPRSDASLVGSDTYLVGKASVIFPGSEKKYRHSSFPNSLEWVLKDCSDGNYLCLDATDGSGAVKRIFVPRHPHIGSTYRLGQASALVSGASSTGSAVIQVLISQSGNDAPDIKLAVQRGRGVIFFDGIAFASKSEIQVIETCVLESRRGYFSQVSVPYSKPEYIVDY